jgi:hypothetical protein
MSVNPYQSPLGDEARKQASGPAFLKGVGTAVLVGGLATLAYGALAFWVFISLPPNGGASGRLPSLYMMGVGIAITLVGLTVRGLGAAGGTQTAGAHGAHKPIPAGIGIVVLVAIIIAVFVVISRL